MPIGSPGRHVFSSKIMVLMAGAASQTSDTLAFTPTPDVHSVPMSIVSLAGEVSTRMAVHAARMPEHGHNRFKGRCGCCIILLCCFGSDVLPGFLFCVCCSASESPSTRKTARCKSHHHPGALRPIH